MLSLNKTVRDVALELPQATRVFERLKIDYCCGGDRPLTEACARAGVEVETLEQMLDEAGQPDLKNKSPTQNFSKFVCLTPVKGTPDQKNLRPTVISAKVQQLVLSSSPRKRLFDLTDPRQG